jgi:hypothetical protein
MTEPRYKVFKVDPPILDEYGVLDDEQHYGVCSEMSKDDAELVATVLNEQAQVVTLIGRLHNYGGHHRWCRYHDRGNDHECNCGWITALVEAVAWRQAINRRNAAALPSHALKGEG